jgi:hypothetical protein
VNRHTFVIQVHPEGLSTLENLSSHERVRITEMANVGPQIERWLEALRDTEQPSDRPADGGRT